MYADITAPEGQRLPVIPPQWASVPAARAHLARQAGRAGHQAAYHSVRAPVYLVRTLAYSVAGLVRLAGRYVAWWLVFEQARLRSKAAAGDDAKAWLMLHEAGRDTRRTRGAVTLFLVLVAAAAVYPAGDPGAVVGALGGGDRRGAAAGPVRSAHGQADHHAGGGDAAVPEADR